MTQRVLAICSSGGHWMQLMRLQRSFEGLDVAYACTRADYEKDVPGHRFYVVGEVNSKSLQRMPRTLYTVMRALLKERPDTIITTGALPGLTALVLGKVFFRSKTIWIDSIANSEQISVSGRHASRIADVFLTQWPHLSSPDGPDYWGAVI
ncbi:UDP-N-acetylglucosamine--LPS N-acetylglucosamine transferase [Maritimibacter alkaliphilus]|uniref:UDP-N-acetylglucosamine--LPS N-acetylglucosamine transferase n=1 Tax=Maritimibacter alkaliphilus TaxID=404236 RepID=UPI001C98BE77|nr:UDP-N-acetylglucosamine--LPS N-acetylglucosamine transferase [Maritimibacter alkaliphilus]MBY6090995.1 UDP-N-acetylglucosamine--LPS N-acetylglucosamine transferase [Maritimibacter alkaliphilus]